VSFIGSPTEQQRRRTGLVLATGTAVASGISVFLNGYGVRAWSEISDATTYTTLKNSAAAFFLIVAAVALTRRGPAGGPTMATIKHNWRGLLLVAVVGGSIPFALFFEGLARASSTDAAFIHKTLLVWVAILAVTFLHEKVGWLHLGALTLLVWGQAVMAGGFGGLQFGPGEWMILAATILWAIETVIAKTMLTSIPSLTLGVARMAGGAVLLIVFGLWRGAFSALTGVTPEHVGWIVVTALTLSAYVGTWHAALARAQAVDVTAVLVGGAIVTALLETGVRGTALPPPAGLVLVAAGVALMLVPWRRPAMAND